MSAYNQSEVARLRQQIELECQALQNLSGVAAGASHAMITHKYQMIEHNQAQLASLVGEKEAKKITYEAYVIVMQ